MDWFGFNLYFFIKYLATGPPKVPANISPSVADARPTLDACDIPNDSIVAPNAAAYPCPPSIDIVPHIRPRRGGIFVILANEIASKFCKNDNIPQRIQYFIKSLPPFLIIAILIERPIMVKKKDIKKLIKLVSIDTLQTLNKLKNKFNIQNNNPPITGEGIQNLLRIFILLFIICPSKSNRIDKIRVCTIFKSKEIIKHLQIILIINYIRYCLKI